MKKTLLNKALTLPVIGTAWYLVVVAGTIYLPLLGLLLWALPVALLYAAGRI